MSDRLARLLMFLLPGAWLALFFVLPFLIVLKISFAEVVLARPPYTPVIEWAGGWPHVTFNFGNYLLLLQDHLYLFAYLNSLKIAALSTLITLAIALPMAYGIVRAPAGWRTPLLVLAILPFWTSFLIRVYAWIGILKTEGLLNEALLRLGLIDAPLTILNTDWAIYIGIVYSYLPFMLLPLYANLEKIPPSLLEAAADLGATPVRTFWRVTVPLAMPGILAGCFLVFIPAVGEFVIPDLLGGADTLMIGKVLWVEFFNNRDWPLASAVAILMLVLLIGPILLLQRQQMRLREAA